MLNGARTWPPLVVLELDMGSRWISRSKGQAGLRPVASRPLTPSWRDCSEKSVLRRRRSAQRHLLPSRFPCIAPFQDRRPKVVNHPLSSAPQIIGRPHVPTLATFSATPFSPLSTRPLRSCPCHDLALDSSGFALRGYAVTSPASSSRKPKASEIGTKPYRRSTHF